MNAHLLAATACLALHGLSAAQDFNVDVGAYYPAPSSGFGAAASQPGVWNKVSFTPPGPISLVDVSGATTGVTIRLSAGNSSPYYLNNAGTQGDDERLLDDIEAVALGPGCTYTIAGLAAGDYTVTTYAWAPDGDSFRSGVSVNGAPETVVGGAWTGSYVRGVTHALDAVTIAPGGNIDIAIREVVSYPSFNGVQIQRGGAAATSFCSGDGSGTPCPCGNAGAAGHGCANSVDAAGARLAGSGLASIAHDTFVLTGSGMPDSAALYFQGSTSIQGGSGLAFGDGLRCAGGTLMRLGTKSNVGGTSSYPTGADPRISVQGNDAAGDVRTYQCWYRNEAQGYCTPSTFNLTNGLQVMWTP